MARMAAARSTGTLLAQLRALMKEPKYGNGKALGAYIIPTGDAHLSEYVADIDKRRDFLSGFTGSAGTAVVTMDKAALWTDGRYYLQAEQQMDNNWTLMKDGLPDTPTQGQWLSKELPTGSLVGVDPFLLGASQWKTIEKELSQSDNTLIGVDENLVDLIWNDQPLRPCEQLLVLSEEFTGKAWQEKIVEVREAMKKEEAEALVITALDEVAWLLNLRGKDIAFNPCWFSYVIITASSVSLFVDDRKLTPDVRQHLLLDQTGDSPTKITVCAYSDIVEQLKQTIADAKGKIWVSDRSNAALTSLVPEGRRIPALTPVANMKAVKNDTEIQGMKKAHVKDAVALCEYICWLEQEVTKQEITEISGSDKLLAFRSQQAEFVSPSFDTISSVGSNGAIIHYKPEEATNKIINTQEIYLCDSGGQYKDGTTDVTRTVHFGTPTDYEKECFTRVLQGHIQLGTAVFPNGVKGHRLDCLARTPLWRAGLEYQHGTGHGVGSFLNVHEGPCSISYRTNPLEVPLEEGMILSNEPGYYEDGKFGIRIESLVVIKKADTKYNYKEKGFLTFEPITWAPIQTKMININLLSQEEIQWVNSYHQSCRDIVGPELKKQGKDDVLAWLMKETEPIA